MTRRRSPGYNPEHSTELFGMAYFSGVRDNITRAIRERRVLARDSAVLWVLLSNMDFPSGRIGVPLRAVAEELGQARNEITHSITRLQRAQLVARCRDSEGVYFLLNPEVVSVGGESTRDRLVRKFTDDAMVRGSPQQLQRIAATVSADAFAPA